MTLLKAVEALVPEHGGRVDWSKKDGLHIAYSSIEHLNGGGVLASEIWQIGATGGPSTALTGPITTIPHLSNDQPAYHPSGEWMLFQGANPDLPLPGVPVTDYEHFIQGGFGFNNDLYVMRLSTGECFKIFEVKAWEAVLHSRFSPDGTRVFWSFSDPPWRGGNGSQLTTATFVVDAGVPQLQNIQHHWPLGISTEKDQVYESHQMSPDNSVLLYSFSPRLPLDFDIWQSNLVTGVSHNLTNAPGEWDEHAHWSPDGRHIAWISSRGFPFTPNNQWQQELRTEVWIMDSSGQNRVQLTFFNTPRNPGFEPGHVISADLEWSPTGDSIVVCRGINGIVQQVLRLDLNMSALR